MTFTYGFYNSVSGDRTYNAVQMSQLMKGILSDGILSSVGTKMVVTNPSGLTAAVGIGRAWFNNTWSDNDAVANLVLDTADVVFPRIDAIVLEINTDTAVRTNSLKIVKGTPASSPVNPTLINTTFVHQYALAYCRVNAGSSTINILTDNVGSVSTPYAKNILDSTLLKATAADVATGTEDTKYVTSKAIKDSLSVPNVSPSGATGQLMMAIYNGTTTVWDKRTNDGWIPFASDRTFTYSSVDGPIGIISTNDSNAKLWPGMRFKYDQTHNQTLAIGMDSNTNSLVGSFTITPTAVTFVGGKFVSAGSFNGTTSKVVITDDTLLKPASGAAFTLSLWIKTSTTGVLQQLYQSYSQNTALAGFELYIDTTNKITAILGKNTGTVAGTDFNTFVGTTTVTDNNWHHVVLTYKGHWAQLYVDGKVEAAGYAYDPAYAATNYIRIGCKNTTGTDGSFYTGLIDDLWFMNGYAIDEETIYSRFTTSSGGQATGTMTITKKAIIIDVGELISGSRLITLYHGTDHELANLSISNGNPQYSYYKAPYGFNINPSKWSVIYNAISTYGPTKASPAAGTWYGGTQLTPEGYSLSAPIGIWDVTLKSEVQFTTTNVSALYQIGITISNTDSSSVYPEFVAAFHIINETATSRLYKVPFAFNYPGWIVKAKTPLYVNIQAMLGTMTSIVLNGIGAIPYLTLRSSYL